MSIIGLGTAAIGRPIYMNIRQNQTKNDTFDLKDFTSVNKKFLQFAYKSGIRHFDTAPNYGIAEKALLEWSLENNYTDLTFSSKWGYTYTANFDPNATVHETKEHSLEKLNEQWDFTQKLLPFLKIYQIHSTTLETGVLDNLEILNRLSDLKYKHGLKIGLTVTGENQNEIIEKALSIHINNTSLFDSIQATYNIFDQSLLQIIEQIKNKKIIIKEALANGRIFPNSNYPHYTKHYEILESLADKHNVGIDAIALRFCMQTIPDGIILSGASTEKQLTENLKANHFILNEIELQEIHDLIISSTDYWKERKKLRWN